MTHSRKRRVRNGGFTLIEVMLVLVIIMIIGGLAVMAYGPVQERAKRQGAEAKLQALKTPLGMYQLSVGDYPSTAQGLEALFEAPSDLASPDKWDGPYIEEQLDADPWGRDYQYAYPGSHSDLLPDIWSLGKDGVDGTDDDITSWKQTD